MLEQDIRDIRENLRRGRYANEAAVSQSIVRRLLGTLGWPIYDPQVVYPEYTVEGRRVDYALCHPASKPRIFVEVKAVGKSEDAERQLFEYAFHMGVPLAVLTDGREWSFFLPAGAGSYDERRIYKLDLVEHDAATSVQRLQRYLRYEAVCSEEAFIAAQEDYRDIAREREIQEALPEAWVKLVAEEDATLLKVVAECVEELCGYRPGQSTVARFLRDTVQAGWGTLPPSCHVSQLLPLLGRLRKIRGRREAPTVKPRRKGTPPPTPTTGSEKEAEGTPTGVGFTLFGEFVPCRNGKEILVGVFEALAERDPTFIEKFVARPRHGRTRRYIAADPRELHPADPSRVSRIGYTHELKSGYWLLLLVDHKARANMIKLACEVAEIDYGTDLRINNPPVRRRPRAPEREHE